MLETTVRSTVSAASRPRLRARGGGWLLLSCALLLGLPIVASLIAHGGLPPGFGVFPPQKSVVAPGFDPLAFVLGLGIALFLSTFLLFPTWFGFARPVAQPRARSAARAAFPPWFWAGGLVAALSWIVMWVQPAALGALVHYTFVPLWWGHILTIDGLVYRRTGGASLLATRPKTLAQVALVSSVCWFYFEYLNYFVLENWYYPYNTIFSTTGYYIWFGLAYTTVLPSIFEWYTLLMTFDTLRGRYANGPKLRVARRGWLRVFWLGAAIMVALVVWPFETFPLLWVAPLMLLAAPLMLARRWTPFVPLAGGNWGPVNLMALACLLNYVLGEMWNYWSVPNNPNFWKYDVPYVNGLLIFEMPLLGFFGYLPFGLLCWMWWIHNAHLCGLDAEIMRGE